MVFHLLLWGSNVFWVVSRALLQYMVVRVFSYFLIYKKLFFRYYFVAMGGGATGGATMTLLYGCWVFRVFFLEYF